MASVGSALASSLGITDHVGDGSNRAIPDGRRLPPGSSMPRPACSCERLRQKLAKPVSRPGGWRSDLMRAIDFRAELQYTVNGEASLWYQRL